MQHAAERVERPGESQEALEGEKKSGKTEVLHLQPSYGICWSHEIETLPQCGFIRF